MARTARKKPDETFAQKLIKKASQISARLLVSVGKPLYLIFYLIVLTILFVLSLIGRSTRLFSSVLIVRGVKFITSTNRRINKLLNKLRKTKIEIKLEKRFPDLGVLFKLLLLKARLALENVHPAKLPTVRINLLTVFLVGVTMSFFGGLIFIYYLLKDLPSPQALTNRDIEVSTKIYDRNGTLLYKIFKDKNRTIIPLEKIPIHVRLASLAIEDAEFYDHPGFSIRGIFRAALRNARTQELSGGSTITQQLVKNALLSSEKTMIRKIREIILSIRVEQAFSKDQILEMYLNEVSYGGTAYGIAEASRVYFDKDVDRLTLAEAALLAGLPKSPTKYSPFGPNPKSSFVRQKEVLHLLRINKFITAKQEEEAANERITFAADRTDIKAPHFVMFVREALVEKYGEEVVEKGGLEVKTTLDLKIQALTEKVVKDEVEKLKNLHVGNGSALVLNPQTGEILAMVGSKDYFDTKNDGNVNVATRPRQPGSSIKVVNYAYALSNGMTPATILDDSPVTFAVPGQPPYTPKNYDGTYRGKLSLRSAFGESRNIPAVKTLASYGVTKMIEQGQKMGIISWQDSSRYGLSLTLGGGEVTLVELARVYATVANYGKRPDIVSILEVKNYKGKKLEKNECMGGFGNLTVQAADAARPACEEQVVDPRVAYLLIDILKDNNARAPAFGNNSALVIPGHAEVAVKTGTSNDLKDNLTVGFNQKYLVATWVGNNDSSPMARIASGVTGASPIWNKIMRALLANEGNHDWEVPRGLVQVPICTLLGTLACEGCPTKVEWFLEEKKPTKACYTPTPTGQPAQILEPAAQTESTPKPKLRFPRLRR